MPKFSQKSKSQLDTCDRRLQIIFNEVIKHIDCTILEGFRDKKKQNEVFEKGLSDVKWPDSKHNIKPSLALDVAPYPIDWNDKYRFYYFAGFILGVSKCLGIELRWGGDWDGDHDFKDQKLNDLVHFELVDSKIISK